MGEQTTGIQDGRDRPTITLEVTPDELLALLVAVHSTPADLGPSEEVLCRKLRLVYAEHLHSGSSSRAKPVEEKPDHQQTPAYQWQTSQFFLRELVYY